MSTAYLYTYTYKHFLQALVTRVNKTNPKPHLANHIKDVRLHWLKKK